MRRGLSPPPCGKHENQREVQRRPKKMKSQKSAVLSCVSMESDRSMMDPLHFKRQRSSGENPEMQERPCGPLASCVSMKSDRSMHEPVDFKGQHSALTKCLLASSGQSTQEQDPDLDSVFRVLEEKLFSLVKVELKTLQNCLSSDQESAKSQREDEEGETEEGEWKRRLKEALMMTTMFQMRKMKQEGLADRLLSKTNSALCQYRFKSNLKKKYLCVFEGCTKAGNPTLLNQIYTELYITEGGTGAINDEHEVRQIEMVSRKSAEKEKTVTCENIFRPPNDVDKPIRTVLTTGVAGIGKTVLTQKFSLDWAEEKANKDIQFTFPLTFKELNMLKEKHFSLVELVHHFFPETKAAGICRFEDFQVVFIFDGLDECRLPLDFTNNKTLTDVTESTSVDVLLTNLIKGNLLPSTRLWITTRPAAANQIPSVFVDLVTEVRGFKDPQKEEYFRKRLPDQQQAHQIISHIKVSRSLHIMCHIPVFCWITATVLEDVLRTRAETQLPNTLTEMYIHFLVVQTKLKKIKYDGGSEADPRWSPESRKMIESLGQLAFEQLLKGNLIFYESDLTECGIDIRAASVYSGVFTQIFREERGLYQDKVFCFVHLSVQEFLAALHVHLTFINSGVNLIATSPKPFQAFKDLGDLHSTAVNKALESPNGHLDMFLRFLLGLSNPNSASLLNHLVTNKGNRSRSSVKIVRYIQKKISEDLCPESSINLFHCLNELKDHSLIKEVQQYLRAGKLTTENPSSKEGSALAFMLLSSGQNLDEFDLKKYATSGKVLPRMLPVIKASKRVLLSDCMLSETSCEAMAFALSSHSSCLRELDLSNNDLRDSGVKLLSTGLESPNCRLESLSLSGCLITGQGCVFLHSALTFNPSHLRELDLSYNHLGEAGVKLLTAKKIDPDCKLDKLWTDYSGEERLRPGLHKYAFKVNLDHQRASSNLKLSEKHTKATALRLKKPQSLTAERLIHCPLLSADGITGRCYWEVEWKGDVLIGVTGETSRSKGNAERWFDSEGESWCLQCTDYRYVVWNMKTRIKVPISPTSRKVGVYVDCAAGKMSFFTVYFGKRFPLYTIHSTFTEPLFPGFGLGHNSSVSVLPLTLLDPDEDMLVIRCIFNP